MKLEEFSQDNFEQASKRLVRSLTRGKTTSSQPKAILLGGQSGAGKTTIHRIKQRNFKVISLLLMEIVIALFIRTTLAYRKGMAKIVWIIPKYSRDKWLNIL